MIVNIIICLAVGYLSGCISTGLIISKIYKVDIRKYGSGNLGMTNALRTLGPKAGIMTFAGDYLKAVIPILLVRFVIFPDAENIQLLALYCGLGTVLGHNFPVWLKFKGGKGISATAGVISAVDPLAIPFGLPLFIVIIAITRYMSLGSLFVAVYIPVWITIRFPGDIHMLAVALVFTVLAFIRHKSNIKRLINGTENKIGNKVSTEKNENNK